MNNTEKMSMSFDDYQEVNLKTARDLIVYKKTFCRMSFFMRYANSGILLQNYATSNF